MHVASALTVGRLAHEMLGRAGFAARVIAVGSRAVYFESSSGVVWWLLPPGSIFHRRCVVAPPTWEGWEEGEVCQSDGMVLRGNRGHAIQWAGASIWEAPPGTSSVSLEESVVALRRGIRGLLLWQQPRGLARLVLGIAPGARHLGSLDVGPMERWLAKARGHVMDVVSAVQWRDSADLLASGSDIVGLGEGLTPSGDDFLGGLLFGLRARASAGHDMSWIDWMAVQDWVTDAASLTNTISHAILADLAAGHGPEPLHDLAQGTLSGGPCEDLARHAARVTRIGHTSGWDMLAGFSAALVGSADSTEFPDVAAHQERRPLAEPSRGDGLRIAAGGIHGG